MTNNIVRRKDWYADEDINVLWLLYVYVSILFNGDLEEPVNIGGMARLIVYKYEMGMELLLMSMRWGSLLVLEQQESMMRFMNWNENGLLVLEQQKSKDLLESWDHNSPLSRFILKRVVHYLCWNYRRLKKEI